MNTPKIKFKPRITRKYIHKGGAAANSTNKTYIVFVEEDETGITAKEDIYQLHNSNNAEITEITEQLKSRIEKVTSENNDTDVGNEGNLAKIMVSSRNSTESSRTSQNEETVSEHGSVDSSVRNNRTSVGSDYSSANNELHTEGSPANEKTLLRPIEEGSLRNSSEYIRNSQNEYSHSVNGSVNGSVPNRSSRNLQHEGSAKNSSRLTARLNKIRTGNNLKVLTRQPGSSQSKKNFNRSRLNTSVSSNYASFTSPKPGTRI